MGPNDRKPTIMGQTSKISNVDLKRVLCYKMLGSVYRDKLSEDEELLALQSDEDFNKSFKKIMTKSNFEGYNIYSPSGLPRVSFLETTKYKFPHCMDIQIEIEPTKPEKFSFLYQGTEVINIKPCLLGEGSINSGCVCAFAIGDVGDRTFAFYKKYNSQIRAIDVTPFKSKTHHVMEFAWGNVLVLFAEDWSPIIWDYNRTVPGLTGDSIALLNYGGFLRSNGLGFNVLQDIVKDKFTIPSWIKEFYPTYPRFKEPTTIYGDNVYLSGYKYISRFKLSLFVGAGIVDLSSEDIKLKRKESRMEFDF
jgi:hypothetical protein